MNIDEEFSYIVRDEILYITYKEQTMTVRVYNCRDLVGQVSDVPMSGSGEGGGYGPGGLGEGGEGEEDVFEEGASETSFLGEVGATDLCQFGGGSGGFGGGEGYGMEMMGGMGMPHPSQHELISVVTQTIAVDSWSEVGGNGSARLFNGLLVVKNTAEVHQQVDDLLQMIRHATQESTRK